MRPGLLSLESTSISGQISSHYLRLNMSLFLANQRHNCKAGPGAMMGRLSSPSHQRGKSLTEGASQIPGTNDSTLHQLKPPHPSHVEGPVSPRCLSLVTYPNPSPSSLTIPRNKRIKATPTRSGRGLPRPASFGSGNPVRERFAIKKPVRHSFGVLVVFT